MNTKTTLLFTTGFLLIIILLGVVVPYRNRPITSAQEDENIRIIMTEDLFVIHVLSDNTVYLTGLAVEFERPISEDENNGESETIIFDVASLFEILDLRDGEAQSGECFILEVSSDTRPTLPPDCDQQSYLVSIAFADRFWYNNAEDNRRIITILPNRAECSAEQMSCDITIQSDGSESSPEVTPTSPPTSNRDSDSDGILDVSDFCPQTGDLGFGLQDDGCPEIDGVVDDDVSLTLLYADPEHLTISTQTFNPELTRIMLHGIEFHWTDDRNTPHSLNLSLDVDASERLDNIEPGNCVQLYVLTPQPHPDCPLTAYINIQNDSVFWANENIVFSVFQDGHQIGFCDARQTACGEILWHNTIFNRTKATVNMAMEWSGPDLILIRFETLRPFIDLRNTAFTVPAGGDLRWYLMTAFIGLDRNDNTNLAEFSPNDCIVLAFGDPDNITEPPLDPRCDNPPHFDNEGAAGVSRQPFWGSPFIDFHVRDLRDESEILGSCRTSSSSCEVIIR